MFAFDFDDLAGSGSGSDAEGGGSGAVGDAEDAGRNAAEPAAKTEEVPYFIGSWAYQGRKGITIYKVRQSGTGHILFEGPDAHGNKLAGVLKWSGPQLQGELVSERGDLAGSIRLTKAEADYAVVSKFRTAGKKEWGRDIKANRYYPAEKASKRAPAKLSWIEEAFTVHPGFIRSGGDLLVEETTLAAAQAKCQHLADCRGFSFKGEPDTDAVVTVYYKSHWSLARGAADWTSFRFEGAILKLSDMPGTGVDEAILTELTKSKFSHVYVFKSPLATFPEWKKNLKVHQIVLLWHPEGTCIQLEYFVGGVHFQRKPWPWIHRRGSELVEEVWPASQPAGGFTGEGVSKVVRKWLLVSREHKDQPVAKDCVIFAMEVVETVGAMTKHLMAHFQTMLGIQYDGWE